jgi:uncharacterized protein
MRFWDASALVPLIIAEPGHETARQEYARDPDIVAWWGTSIECVSAVARREREGAAPRPTILSAVARLDALAASWQEVGPTDRLRASAMRLLRVHVLRAADALQLAAATEAAEHNPESLPFVTLDDRLAEAAEREGFSVLQPS